MRRCEAGAIIAFVILMQGPVEGMSFNILRAILSPPVPRITRVRNASPRELRLKNSLAVSDFLGLVKQYHYPAEEHNVTTIDGYNLRFHRIPGSARSSLVEKKPVVFVQHGISASSDSWVLMGPGRDLVFLLADAGYDVWVGNFRGNSYSRSHVVLSPEDPKFWQFSFHEMAYYDLPAMIDYALDHTGQKSLIYIGHSMGTTTSYILLSERPEYNNRLRLVVSFAPVAYWKHGRTGIQKLLVDNGDFIEQTLRNQGIHELYPQSTLITQLLNSLCNENAATHKVCLNVYFRVFGSDPEQFNTTLIPYLVSYFPAGMSLKTLAHYYQHLSSGQFRQYDYGYVENFGRYQQAEPPAYDVSKITAPVALFYGRNDPLSREVDVVELKKRLTNVVASVAISYPAFNHVDFVWATDAKRLLYDDTIELIHQYK
ncbi:lipase 3-like [Neodiprion fabricii]|uniref:lipase 3-like n=1 Tax=Neodiprion fabricii TaxID=2872261 RepID=UPI001ED94D26|nr:lipase 3-like [Neodiprion fabricii]